MYRTNTWIDIVPVTYSKERWKLSYLGNIFETLSKMGLNSFWIFGLWKNFQKFVIRQKVKSWEWCSFCFKVFTQTFLNLRVKWRKNNMNKIYTKGNSEHCGGMYTTIDYHLIIPSRVPDFMWYWTLDKSTIAKSAAFSSTNICTIEKVLSIIYMLRTCKNRIL